MITDSKYLRIVFVMWLAAMIGMAFAAKSDEPKSYIPTEVQSLRLQVKQRDAQIAQRDVLAAQQRFAALVQQLQVEAENVKTEQKWDKSVVFNVDTLTFSEAPKPEPKPEVKPEVKKPEVKPADAKAKVKK